MAKVSNYLGDFASLVDGDDHLKETQQSSRLIHGGYFLKLACLTEILLAESI